MLSYPMAAKVNVMIKRNGEKLVNGKVNEKSLCTLLP